MILSLSPHNWAIARPSNSWRPSDSRRWRSFACATSRGDERRANTGRRGRNRSVYLKSLGIPQMAKNHIYIYRLCRYIYIYIYIIHVYIYIQSMYIYIYKSYTYIDYIYMYIYIYLYRTSVGLNENFDHPHLGEKRGQITSFCFFLWLRDLSSGRAHGQHWGR